MGSSKRDDLGARTMVETGGETHQRVRDELPHRGLRPAHLPGKRPELHLQKRIPLIFEFVTSPTIPDVEGTARSG
ncbi:MAG: hypothetical protein ACRDQU_17150 [Pseudonocardiaceae bacterium]